MLLTRIPPIAFGLATLGLVLGVVEILLRLQFLNQFVIPLPSAVFGSFGRLFSEEELARRLLLTGMVDYIGPAGPRTHRVVDPDIAKDLRRLRRGDMIDLTFAEAIHVMKL